MSAANEKGNTMSRQPRSSPKSLVLTLMAVACLWLAGAAPGLAQSNVGTLEGTVTDPAGKPVSGATVTLTGGPAPQEVVTDDTGRYRFLGLEPHGYVLDVQAPGYARVAHRTYVNAGMTVTFWPNLTKGPEDLDEVAQYIRGSYDGVLRLSEEEERDRIPTPRDPWAVLQSTPGVLTDRINVGGNESGQQSQFVGLGSSPDQNTWSVDGVTITDMTAIGSNPAYYDFDAFEELQLTTGGRDASVATGGLTAGIVTKRGTNEWRGSGRYFLSEGENTTSPAFALGNRIVSVQDYGAELGGPIVKDRLWIWGSYGAQSSDLDLNNANEHNPAAEASTLNRAAKLSAQLSPVNRFVAAYYGSGADRSSRPTFDTGTPATWATDSGTAIYKLEDTHIFSSNFYLTGLYALVQSSQSLTAPGGDQPAVFDGSVWRNSFLQVDTERPQQQVKANGSYFFDTGALSHELKFGASYRNAESTDESRWPGDRIGVVSPQGDYIAYPAASSVEAHNTYAGSYVEWALRTADLAVALGVRSDSQSGRLGPNTLTGNRFFPVQVPSFTEAEHDTFEWQDITPRLGLTYALGAKKTTLLRAGYSQFVDLASIPITTYGSAVQSGSVNGSYATTPQGVALGFLGTRITSQLAPVNRVAADLVSPRHSLTYVGGQHGLRPGLFFDWEYRRRSTSDPVQQYDLVVDGTTTRAARADDWQLYRNVPAALPGHTKSLPAYTLRSGISFATGDGQILDNGLNSAAAQEIAFGMSKRLADRGLFRASVNVSDWTSTVPASELARRNPGAILGAAQDGQPVVVDAIGRDVPDVFINSRWSFNVNGWYQVGAKTRWALDLSFNINGRDGYPLIYFQPVSSPDGNSVNLLAEPLGERRHDPVFVADFGLRKTLNPWRNMPITLSFDAFNVTDSATVLGLNGNLATGGNTVRESVSPRVLRFGARVSFR